MPEDRRPVSHLGVSRSCGCISASSKAVS